jgi:hypothetical protein
MKNPKRGKKIPNQTILIQPAYWRLRAEILAIKDLLGMVFVDSLMEGKKLAPQSKEYDKLKKEFEKRFKHFAAVRHDQLLTELEDLSPELAALLDKRSLDEVEPQ